MNIPVDVQDNKIGNWSVETFIVPENDLSQRISIMKTGRGVPAGTYKKLVRDGVIVMSNTPDEIRDFRSFVNKAHGSILVNGLGLGVILKALLNKPEVTEITVIEISEDVIDLVSPAYKDDRLTIINESAFDYKPPKGKKYDFVWHDIWDYICGDNTKEMGTLHRKYGRRTDVFQDSWCKKECQRANRESKPYQWRW